MDISQSRLLSVLDQPESLRSEADAISPPDFRDAAVIVPLTLRDNQIHLIFNKRANHLETHAGQVGFPGGRRDPDDRSLLETAVRELEEELGLKPQQHRPLCRLRARQVISYYQVTPFVSWVDPEAVLSPDPAEVAYAFDVPLSHFVQPGTQSAAVRNIFGKDRTFYSWTYGSETIWGATGRIMADFLIALGAEHLSPA